MSLKPKKLKKMIKKYLAGDLDLCQEEFKTLCMAMKKDCKWFYDQGWEMNEDGHYSFNDAWEIYTDSSKKVSK